MKSKEFMRSDDAVAVSVGFILMFAVTVLLFTAIIISFYSLSQSTEKSAMKESFKVMGSGLAAKMTMVDTLVNITKSYGGTVNTLEYEFTLPATVANKPYRINVTNSTYKIILDAENGASVGIPLNMSTNFYADEIYSGAENYIFVYKNDTIYIEEV
ncbi:Uncharacterised protein [uncultured archaeon]|nr:Uncharacterised protein [uncultured archaeon]